jgi:hypothetical protein
MKKNILKNFIGLAFLIAIIFTGFNTDAATNAHLNVTIGGKVLYDRGMSVSPCDSNNDGILDPATAYCALVQSGLNINGSWSSFGYFLTGIGNVEGYADSFLDWHYWEFYLNGGYAPVGISSHTLISGDIILLNFLNPSDEDIKKSQSINTGGILWRDEFSIDNAVEFLSSKQEEDGSFGNSLYTDWVAIGLAKNKIIEDEVKNKLKEYIKTENFKGINITDYERHAMALMSMGIDPYDGTDINYIKKIIDSFDGNQIGDKNLINDDIFGLIVLQNAGYTKDDRIISAIISNILKNQNVSGSWGSIDMTSASIMALHDFKDFDGVKDSIRRAFKFIKSNEIIKGCKSFGNSFTASWAMQAFSTEDWYEDEVERSLKFLARKQDNEDGFMKEGSVESSIWATAYTLPAVSKLAWNDILDNFSKR